MPIKRKVGDKMSFTGGAENTPTVTVARFQSPDSLNTGELQLRIKQEQPRRDNYSGCAYETVCLSLETMKEIIEWAEKE